MIQINQDEALYLEKQGLKFDHHIHTSHTKHKKYYLTEDPRFLKLLNKYRNSKGL